MKKLSIALAAFLFLILLIVLVLPLVFDADRYRGLVESRAEKALGRDVRLGEMRLSLFPTLGLEVDEVGVGALPEEGGGDLLTARRLRVGARLGPLLRKRLEVTSLVLEEPSMVLARDREGHWNVERLVVGDAAVGEGDATTGDGELSIDRLRLSGGTLDFRDGFGEQPLQVVLSDVDLELDGFSPGAVARFELATSFATDPETRVVIVGQGGPFGGVLQSSPELHADVEIKRMTGDLLTQLATVAGFRVDSVFGARPFDASMRLDMTPGSTSLSDLLIEDADLELRRDQSGRLNFAPPESDETSGATAFNLQDVRLGGVRLRLRDASQGPKPLDVVLDGLDAELDRWPPEEPSSFRMVAGVAGGDLEVSGRASPGAAGAFDLELDVGAKKLPGSLIAGLAVAAGADLDSVFGDQPIDVDARVEVTAETTTVTQLELRGADLDLRRDRGGRWNFTLPEGGGAADSPGLAVRDVVLDGFRLRLRDETVGKRPLDAVFDGLRLELDRLPSEGPATFRLISVIAGDGGSGEIEVSGQAGPTAAGGDLPLRLTAKVGGLPLAAVQPMFDVLAGVGPGVGRADLDLTASGTFPSRLETTGSVLVTGAKVAAGESGQERLIDLDLGARFDATISRGGEDFEIRTLDVDLEGSTLSVRGTVKQESEARRWDMALAPTRLPTDRLQALLGLFVQDTGLTFSASEPIEIEARAQGSTAPGETMDISGRVVVKDLRLVHPALTMPLEQVAAEARFRGETVEISDLSARIGSNDLTGEMTVTGFAAPRLTFDLRAEQADLGELLSLAAEDGDTAAAGESPASASAPLFAEGDLRLAAGSWDTLVFTDLTAHLRLEDDVVTLDPAAMKLYGGSFHGRVVADLTTDPTAFEILGNAEGIDVDPFLSSNLNLGNLLFGRFTGELQARGAGSDYESMLESLTGDGTARVDDGRLARTDLLAAVAKVAGVLGQRTLSSLANRLATESTRFERLEGSFRLAAGKMRFEEFLLDSPDFALRGKGLADLLSSVLDGEFRIGFSRELSELMRLEGSRAAEVFWDPESDKVAMPLALKGSFEAPTATVDWSSAVGGYAKRRAKEGLLDILGKALGGKDREEGESPPPSPEPSWGGSGRDLGAEITDTRWGGSILFQDLKLGGVVRGYDIDQASLEAVDAGGRVIRRWDRLHEVNAYRSSGDPSAYAEIRWQARIDGKDLALARFPVTLELTVYDRAGDRAEATRVVEK